MIRFALRGFALTFGVIALLLGGVMAASGAFRPVRFFAVAMGQPRQLTLVSNLGEFYPLTVGDAYSGQQTSFGNHLVMYREGILERMTLWVNGQTRRAGIVNGDPEWSVNGLFAWSGQTPNNSGQLKMWDGETIHLIEEGKNIYAWGWVGTELWAMIRGVGTRRSVISWDYGQVSEVYTNDRPFTVTQFLPCGAMKLSFEEGDYFYYSGEMTPLPTVNSSRAAILSHDCQTFVYNYWNYNTQHSLLMESGSQTSLPFSVVQLRNGNELLGIEPSPESPNDLILVHAQGGNIHRRVWTFDESAGSKGLLLWSGEFSLWRLLQPSGYNLLIWNQQTDEIQIFPLASYDQIAVDAPNERVAWANMQDRAVLQLMLWQDRRLTQQDIRLPDLPQGIYQANLTWMNDDSLMISMFRNAPPFQGMHDTPQTFMYRWQNGEIELFTVIPDFSTPLTDWMTWE